jgi:hypothetical protein
MPKQKSSIGLPKGLSRDNAYIQGVFDGEEGYMQMPRKVKEYEVTCVVKIVFNIETFSTLEATDEVLEYLAEVLPIAIEEDDIKVLDMYPYHVCAKKTK